MKSLFTFLTIFLIISCEGGSGEQGGATSPSSFVGSDITEESIVNNIQFYEGTYQSQCVYENGDYYKYWLVIDSYEVRLGKYQTINSNCEGQKSIVTVTYNINGSSLDYVESDYVYFSSAGGDYICGNSSMISGTHYNIDGINCSQSYENFSINSYLKNGSDYSINDLVFTSL